MGSGTRAIPWRCLKAVPEGSFTRVATLDVVLCVVPVAWARRSARVIAVLVMFAFVFGLTALLVHFGIHLRRKVLTRCRDWPRHLKKVAAGTVAPHWTVVSLSPTDTLTNTVWRDHVRTLAGRIPCGCRILNTPRTETVTPAVGEGELKNRWGAGSR